MCFELTIECCQQYHDAAELRTFLSNASPIWLLRSAPSIANGTSPRAISEDFRLPDLGDQLSKEDACRMFP